MSIMANKIDADKEVSRKIFQHVVDSMGQRPTIGRHWDEPEKVFVDVASAVDHPGRGMTTYTTLSLSNKAPPKGSRLPRGVRVELIASAPTAQEAVENIVATSAFCISKTRWLSHPGEVFPDVVKMYYPKTALPHVLLAHPWPWGRDLELIDFGTRIVTWLMVVPISEGEYQFAIKSGSGELVAKLREAGIESSDVKRRPVV